MGASRAMHANQKGITLVELIVTSAVTVVVAGAILYFVSFTGDGTNQIRAMQQLEQESAIISELFLRNVRNGNYICANADLLPPNANVDNLTKITIRAGDEAHTAVATFEISGSSLLLNGSQYLTAYLAELKTPSHFKVFQNGKHAEFYLCMSKKVGNDIIDYTQTIGDVRCKN
jgi:Tfp pilus assembly protein PilE